MARPGRLVAAVVVFTPVTASSNGFGAGAAGLAPTCAGIPHPPALSTALAGAGITRRAA